MVVGMKSNSSFHSMLSTVWFQLMSIKFVLAYNLLAHYTVNSLRDMQVEVSIKILPVLVGIVFIRQKNIYIRYRYWFYYSWQSKFVHYLKNLRIAYYFD